MKKHSTVNGSEVPKDWPRIVRWTFGFLFIALALLLAVGIEFWNAQQLELLSLCARTVISINSQPVQTTNDSKLVHVSGMVSNNGALSDNDTGASVDALKLRRTVEMFQWKEEEKTRTAQTTTETKTTSEDQAKGKKKTESKKTTETTKSTTTEHFKTYPRVWSEEPIDSAQFKDATNKNPPMALRSKTISATDVHIGAFVVSSNLLENLNNYDALPATADLARKMATKLTNVVATEEGFYVGTSQNDPQVGDLRIRFEMVPVTNLSVVARQSGNLLDNFVTKSGGTIGMITVGQKSAQDVIRDASLATSTKVWIVRVMGFIFSFLAVVLLLRPIVDSYSHHTVVQTLDQIPNVFCWLLVSLVVCATAIGLVRLWFFPFSGASLLAAVGVSVFAFQRSTRRQRPRPHRPKNRLATRQDSVA